MSTSSPVARPRVTLRFRHGGKQALQRADKIGSSGEDDVPAGTGGIDNSLAPVWPLHDHVAHGVVVELATATADGRLSARAAGRGGRRRVSVLECRGQPRPACRRRSMATAVSKATAFEAIAKFRLLAHLDVEATVVRAHERELPGSLEVVGEPSRVSRCGSPSL